MDLHVCSTRASVHVLQVAWWKKHWLILYQLHFLF